MLNSNHKNEEHIQIMDMERYENAVQKLSESDRMFIQSINEKTDSCLSCQRRFDFYFDSKEILKKYNLNADQLFLDNYLGYAPNEEVTRNIFNKINIDSTLLEKVQVALESFSSKNNINNLFKDWLDGGRQLLGQIQGLTVLSPIVATRGNGFQEEAPVIEFSVILNEDGFFKFQLEEEQTIKLKIPSNTVSGQAIFVVIFKQDEKEFSAVYPLITIGKSGVTGNITLSSGKYILCIPTK